ncbi:glycerophosphodiester phosphodiesterase family protein [Fulvivirgaceae bacterium BMA12]|uniref:Glycerophosphodiester phosphodiesterase family protein n=1 Tax=Agaribacillus aureus TaxID=3051825 RepID=A0ABT8LC28_9BACT|nr:glycerophosphodiester phosphodiesterase family protein [Fulvivirgaceae bacterium BMA12]
MRYRYSLVWIIFLIICFSCQKDKSRVIQSYSTTNAKEFFKWKPDRSPLISAHRGGPSPGFPENCLETFENTLSHVPALIECDVNISKDGYLVMMHDDKVDRTTDGTGYVDGLSLAQLQQLKLKDNEGNITDFKIPTLKQVLEWAKGKALVSIDAKRGVPFDKVIRLIEETGAEENVTIIVYNVENAIEVHRLNPSLMLSMTIRNKDELLRVKKAGIPMENVIAFTGVRLLDESHYNMLHREGIFCILGTLGNLDKRAEKRGDDIYLSFIKKGVDILATDRPVAAARAIGVFVNE